MIKVKYLDKNRHRTIKFATKISAVESEEAGNIFVRLIFQDGMALSNNHISEERYNELLNDVYLTDKIDLVAIGTFKEG